MAWTEAHAARLLWRAGFGPRPGEARKWARAGRAATLKWILAGGGKAAPLKGPEPRVDGKPLDPGNEWGHDALWWLDRMVRTTRPLEEKLTLFWADHFACTDQDTPLQLALNRTLRTYALGSFGKLLHGVTVAPAMLLFLSLADSDKDAPNENYARELMELFTLGSGYTETDIREAARALTGWRSKWGEGGLEKVFYDAESHDAGSKRIFGHSGRFDFNDVLRLVVEHPQHAPFLVEKLWAFFVTKPLGRRTRADLVRTYVRSGHRIKPVVAKILAHPALYADLDAPDMVKAPVVFLAGNLRALGRGIDDGSWTWLLDQMGMQLFSPPSVAGWEWGPAWLSTTTMRARFMTGNYLLDGGPAEVSDKQMRLDMKPSEHLDRALAATGHPWISKATRSSLLAMAERLRHPEADWERQPWADMTQRAMRHLLLTGPDAHLH